MMNGKRILLFAFFFTVVSVSSAQIKFQRTYGIGLYNEGRSIKQTFDGGYIVAGSETDAGNGSSDVYLLKIDSLGNFVWNKTFGGSSIDRGYSVEQLSDSGYIVCGYTNSFGNGGYDGYLIRTDKNGDTLWTKTYGGVDWDFIYTCHQTSDSGFILAGNSFSNMNGSSESFLVKTDSAGNFLWSKSLVLADQVFINAMSVSPEGGFVMAGYKINHVDASEDIFVIKTNSNGDTLWTKSVGGTNEEKHANAIDVNPTDSSIVVAGYSKDLLSGNSDDFFFKLDPNGNTIFTTLYQWSGEEMINDIHFDNHDNVGFIIGAYTTSFGGGGKDVHFILADTSGNFLIGLTHGGQQNEIPYHAERTHDGGYIICGSSTSYTPGLQSVYILRYDSLFQTSSIAIGIQEPKLKPDCLYNYPNPFFDYTIFDLKNTTLSENLNLSIFNLLGENVFSSAIGKKEQVIFYRKNLPGGIYLFRLSDREKILGYGKLIAE